MEGVDNIVDLIMLLTDVVHRNFNCIEKRVVVVVVVVVVV
jgi:hypothetical protein